MRNTGLEREPISHLLGEGVCGRYVDEVLVVELVVLPEEVHVRRDLRRPCPLDGEAEVRGERGLIAGIFQGGSGLHLRVQAKVSHPMLPELDGHLQIDEKVGR